MADGTKMFTTDVGSVSLRVWSEEKNNAVTTTIQDVYYHEKVTVNLLSWGKLAKLGWILHSSDKGSYVVTPSKNRVPLSTRGQVLVMEHEESERVNMMLNKKFTTAEDLVRLHERLGHMEFESMITAMKAETTLDLGANWRALRRLSRVV